MPTDADFLRKLNDDPADDTLRLVYADWLDEQPDGTSKARAEFLRLELRMALAPERSLNRARWLNKLQALAVGLDPIWLAAVSHPKLEACRLRFRFECPKQWEKLTPTGAPKVRFCESCRQTVHYCDTLDEARRLAVAGNCVAVSLALVRRPGDLTPPREILAGDLLPADRPVRRMGRVYPRPRRADPEPDDAEPEARGRERPKRDSRRRNRNGPPDDA